jgi:hypothetical protein
MEQSHRDEMNHMIREMADAELFEGKAVFAFGHCNATEEMIDILFANSIAVCAVLDNNEAKRTLSYRGVPVRKPAIIQAFDASCSLVLIATRFYASMAAQLRGMGYGGEIVKAVDYNSFADYTLAEETFRGKKERVLRGAGVLQRIREQYPSRHLVICPHSPLGDVYWALAFLPAYCEKHGIREAAVAVQGDACRQIAELFRIDDIITLDRAEMDELVQAVLFTREENCVIAHHDRPYTDNIIKYLDKHFLSFTDYYRYAVYGLSETAAPALPSGGDAFVGSARIEKGGTVILSPHAKSVVQPPDSFWESLTEEYRRKGFFVCTNVTGNEEVIRGTSPLSVPLSQVIAAAEYAGQFVGLRSGLCDILSTAKCRKTVVFPDCAYSTTPHKVEDFFALPGWEKIVWRE